MDTFDPRDMSLSTILSRVARGEQPVCWCGAPILVAATPQQAKALGIPPGMQCSRSTRHYQAVFDFPFPWDQIIKP